MALGPTLAALRKRAAKQESKELRTNSISPEFVSKTLDPLLVEIYGKLRPKPEDYEQRDALVKAFNRVVKDAYGANGECPVVEAFGSFTMDLFTAGSDLDLSINFSNEHTPEFSRDRKVSVLRKLTNFLYKVQSDGRISDITPVLMARVPVVKVVDSGTGIECDISAENKDGISRSSFFALIGSIDRRFSILCYLMKAWAKSHNINSSKDQTMNSLSIISLVAFHLQTRDPPVLPPFSALLKDGSDVSSIQKAVGGFEHFGKKNEECIAKLFITLLIKLSAVETLWPQGLCASTLQGSWTKKEWKGNLHIEDFLDPCENFGRTVGKSQLKTINICVKDSLKLLSSFAKDGFGEKELKDRLVEFFALVPNDHITSKQVGTKRPITSNKNNRNSNHNSTVAKRMRYTEDVHHDIYIRPPPSWPNACLPPPQTNHVESHFTPYQRSQFNYGPNYQTQTAGPLTLWPNPILPDLLDPFHPSRMEDHVRPFGIPQSGPISWPPNSFHCNYGLHNQQPSLFAPNVGKPLNYSLQPPGFPSYTSQLSHGMEHQQGPVVHHQFSSIWRHYPPY